MAKGEQSVENMMRIQTRKRTKPEDSSDEATNREEPPLKLMDPEAKTDAEHGDTDALLVSNDPEMSDAHGIPTMDDFEPFVPIKDWREEHHNCFSAFMRGKLMPIDYMVHLFMILAMLSDIALGVTSYYVTDTLTYGTSIAVLLAVFALILFPLLELFSTGKPLEKFEETQIALGVILNFGYGLLYYLYELS